MKFKKKPVEIEAVHFCEDPIEEVLKFLGFENLTSPVAVYENSNARVVVNDTNVSIVIKTLEGDMIVSEGDYIIKDIKGEFYPCKPDIFEKTYDKIDSFLDRLEAEHQEVFVRAFKYASFIESDKFRETIKDDYSAFLLWYQSWVMERYISILKQRIDITKGYENVSTLPGMNFGDAIKALQFGLLIRRKGWNGKGLAVIKQIPSHIEGEIIPKMTSLPESAKSLISKGNGFIDYVSQCLIYNENTGRADSWVPSISDVFANDWEVVDSK